MRSAVDAAVLSLVIEKPSYGSEISRRFEDRYGGLLAHHRQHIYRALTRLKDDGLVESIPLLEASVRHGVRATARGAQTYRAWLREPVRLTGDAPWQLKLRFASTRSEDVETVRYLIDEYERAVLTLARGGAVRSDNLVERALDEERRVSVDAALRWVAWVRDELRERERAP